MCVFESLLVIEYAFKSLFEIGYTVVYFNSWTHKTLIFVESLQSRLFFYVLPRF